MQYMAYPFPVWSGWIIDGKARAGCMGVLKVVGDDWNRIVQMHGTINKVANGRNPVKGR